MLHDYTIGIYRRKQFGRTTNRIRNNQRSNKTMRSIAEMILESIKYGIDKNEVGCDKTYTSVIKSVNSNGTYTILDNGGTDRKVKCCIPGAVLTVGQSVWVKEPCGNLNELHICGVK